MAFAFLFYACFIVWFVTINMDNFITNFKSYFPLRELPGEAVVVPSDIYLESPHVIRLVAMPKCAALIILSVDAGWISIFTPYCCATDVRNLFFALPLAFRSDIN